MRTVQSYTLAPDQYTQAVEYARARNVVHFGGVFISALVLVAIIRLRLVPRMRRLPGASIIAALVLLTGIFDLPVDVYAHATSLRYHISIQPWPAWFWDWTKGELVSVVIAVAVLLPFYALLRGSPRRWWWYAWLASIPVMLFSAYADPLLLEPLFNDFKPLSATHPELIEPIEKLLARAGIGIPRERLFEMEASRKTNSLNAYVSGFGPSRRVVLYDTIIRKEEGPPLLTTVGHELGHYVLDHIAKGLAFGSVSLLLALYLLYRTMPGLIARHGGRFDIQGVSDWASLPAFLLAALLLGFVSEPVVNAYSRRQEHAADAYSLRVTRGLLADPGQAAAQAFQIEGETDLEEPDPPPFIVFWLYSHPPVADRLRFALRSVE